MESHETIWLNCDDKRVHRCPECGLVATRETPWLAEAYTSAIHDADSGLLRRARRLSAMTSAIIRFEGIKGGHFLDWAAGYGVFTQAMRDKGFDQLPRLLPEGL